MLRASSIYPSNYIQYNIALIHPFIHPFTSNNGGLFMRCSKPFKNNISDCYLCKKIYKKNDFDGPTYGPVYNLEIDLEALGCAFFKVPQTCRSKLHSREVIFVLHLPVITKASYPQPKWIENTILAL
jgi:hypothetical protein